MIRNTELELLVMKLRPHLFLDMFHRELGTLGALKAIEFRIRMLGNLTPHFDEADVVEDLVRSSLEHLEHVGRNFLQTGYWRIHDAVIGFLSDVLDLADDADDICTRREMLNAATAALDAVESNPINRMIEV